MEAELAQGTERVINGQRRVFYDGYWVRAYDVPGDRWQAKRQLIEAMTRRLFQHTEPGINIPGDVSTGKIGRGLPDVSGDGDPASGYRVRVDGQEFPIGGTSAVAPLWAGLIALVNQKLQGRAGFINPLLYADPSGLRDVTNGDNKVGDQLIGYNARQGWDPCTGLGSPDGDKLLAVLDGSSMGSSASSSMNRASH